jgi:hypothetical protein
LTVDDRHPEFFRLGGIEQHAFHGQFPGATSAARKRGIETAGAATRGVAALVTTRRARGKTVTAPALADDGREQNDGAVIRSKLKASVFPRRNGSRRVRSSCSRTGVDVWRRFDDARWNAPACNEQPQTEILASCAAQLASSRPLPGAETALFLYDRYFSGNTPAGERFTRLALRSAGPTRGSDDIPTSWPTFAGRIGRRCAHSPTIISE